MTPTIKIPTGAYQLINRLNTAGFDAFAVGGCVRDSLMGKNPTDWDITTPALPAQIAEIFADTKQIGYGERHGTISVKAEGAYYEITTYRIDGAYSDGRRPDSVSFTPNLTDDLRRRDFTINAMAFSPKTGLIDPFGGLDDINSKTIRCVGSPQDRFTEDYLRILRAYRFAATLGFALDEKTHHAAKNGRHNLDKIARERIGAEITKLLVSTNTESIVTFLEDCADVIFPDLAALRGLPQINPHHIYDAYDHTIETLRHTPSTLHQRLAAIYHDTGKLAVRTTDENGQDHFKNHENISHAIAERAMTHYALDNPTKNMTLAIVKNHMKAIPTERVALKQLTTKLTAQTIHEILTFQLADNSAKSPLAAPRLTKIGQTKDLLEQILKEGEPIAIKDLALTGQDIMRHLQIPPGPQVGKHLNALLSAVIQDPALNTKHSLINLIGETQ